MRNLTKKQHLRIITTYNNQHLTIKKYIKRYWHLLASDSKISRLITSKPLIIYWLAFKLKDKLFSTTFRSSGPSKSRPPKGTFPWGTCNPFQFICTNNNQILLNGRTFVSKNVANSQRGSYILWFAPVDYFTLAKQLGNYGVGSTST